MNLKIFGNPLAIISLLILVIWLFGGANFLFQNPIVIVFGLLLWFMMAMGDKR